MFSQILKLSFSLRYPFRQSVFWQWVTMSVQTKTKGIFTLLQNYHILFHRTRNTSGILSQTWNTVNMVNCGRILFLRLFLFENSRGDNFCDRWVLSYQSFVNCSFRGFYFCNIRNKVKIAKINFRQKKNMFTVINLVINYKAKKSSLLRVNRPTLVWTPQP